MKLLVIICRNPDEILPKSNTCYIISENKLLIHPTYQRYRRRGTSPYEGAIQQFAP